MLNLILKILVAVSCISLYFFFRDAKLPRYPLFSNFLAKNAVWILIYPVFQFSHTSDLVMYQNFLMKRNSGLIPNQDFEFPYGPLFLPIFELLNPLDNFIFWYFFLTLIDTAILKFLIDRKENSKEIFWFWVFNPLNIIFTCILGQNQILILFFATLSLIFYSNKVYRVSVIHSLGAIYVKMIQFLYLPGFFIYLWLKNKKLIWLSIVPIMLYSLIGLTITPKWFVGVQNELDRLCPGNISFWFNKIFPGIDLNILQILSGVCVFAVSYYCIRNFRIDNNLLIVSTFVTLIVFLLTNSRNYPHYWIFTLPLLCLIQEKKLQRLLMSNLAIVSMLAPIELSFYFNIIREGSSNNYFVWFVLFLLDSSILYLGFSSLLELMKFQRKKIW